MNTLKVEIRDPKSKAKQLRRAGIIPCNIFGPELEESIAIQVPKREVLFLLRKSSVGSTVSLDVNGKKILTLVKEIAKNELKDEVEHISFHALSKNRKVNNTAPIVLLNKDRIRGYVSQALFEIPYTALPADLIDTVVIDLENRQPGTRITVADLEIYSDETIELLVDPDTMILNITEPATMAEEETAEDGAEEEAAASDKGEE
ncbi:MAG: 50S ribosomal protein L25 [Anaerovoracaceae bacterium]|jgi:large subunit ribosomal protein L25